MIKKLKWMGKRLYCLWRNMAMLSKPSWPDDLILRHFASEIKYLRSRVADLQYGLDGLSQLEDRLSALQALDISFRSMGKVVILSRVGNRDVCKILDIKPQTTWAEIRHLTQMVKDVYGVDVDRIDAPNAVTVEEFLRITSNPKR